MNFNVTKHDVAVVVEAAKKAYYGALRAAGGETTNFPVIGETVSLLHAADALDGAGGAENTVKALVLAHRLAETFAHNPNSSRLFAMHDQAATVLASI